MTGADAIRMARALVSEDRIDEARDILLKAGFEEQLDDDVQQAFASLIPIGDTLQAVLSGPLADLQSAEVAVRRKAIALLAREFFTPSPRYKGLWMRDPRATAPIIAAMDDEDPKVVEDAVAIISEISRLHFRDRRAYPVVVRLLQSRREGVRVWAARSAGFLDGPASCRLLFPLLRDRAQRVRAEVILVFLDLAQKGELVGDIVPDLQRQLLEALTDPSSQIRGRAANALRDLGDSSVIGDIEAAADRETEPVVKDSMTAVVRYMRQRA